MNKNINSKTGAIKTLIPYIWRHYKIQIIIVLICILITCVASMVSTFFISMGSVFISLILSRILSAAYTVICSGENAILSEMLNPMLVWMCPLNATGTFLDCSFPYSIFRL